MRAVFRDEFERKVVKAARKFCDKIYTLSTPYPVYWQFVYNGETYFSTASIYDKLVQENKIQPFNEHIINEHYGLIEVDKIVEKIQNNNLIKKT